MKKEHSGHPRLGSPTFLYVLVQVTAAEFKNSRKYYTSNGGACIIFKIISSTLSFTLYQDHQASNQNGKKITKFFILKITCIHKNSPTHSLTQKYTHTETAFSLLNMFNKIEQKLRVYLFYFFGSSLCMRFLDGVNFGRRRIFPVYINN